VGGMVTFATLQDALRHALDQSARGRRL